MDVIQLTCAVSMCTKNLLYTVLDNFKDPGVAGK